MLERALEVVLVPEGVAPVRLTAGACACRIAALDPGSRGRIRRGVMKIKKKQKTSHESGNVAMEDDTATRASVKRRGAT